MVAVRTLEQLAEDLVLAASQEVELVVTPNEYNQFLTATPSSWLRAVYTAEHRFQRIHRFLPGGSAEFVVMDPIDLDVE